MSRFFMDVFSSFPFRNLSQCYIFNLRIHIQGPHVFKEYHFCFNFVTMFFFQPTYTHFKDLMFRRFSIIPVSNLSQCFIFSLRIHIPRNKCFAFFLDVFSSFLFQFCHNVLFSTHVYTFQGVNVCLFGRFFIIFVSILSHRFISNLHKLVSDLVFHDNFHHFRFEYDTMSYFQSPYTRFQLTLVITFLLFS